MPSELWKCPDFCVCYFFFFFIIVFFFSPFVLLFWSKMVCVAVCRLELNAADWNLNCDLAVANCESAAELPVKPLSSLLSRFLFVGWFISLHYSVCLGFCYCLKFRSTFCEVSFYLETFYCTENTSFLKLFSPNIDVSFSSHVLQF